MPNGQGTISSIIAALNWVAVNAKTYNIKVVNMSVGAGVYESYWTDPLTLAAKALTDKGITVVAAAGNLDRNAADGKPAVGRHHGAGQRAVGAHRWRVEHQRARDARTDDQMAWLQLLGPDRTSISARSRTSWRLARARYRWQSQGSLLYATKPAYLLNGEHPARLQAVPGADRHEHGGAGGHGHRRADAARPIRT